MGLAFARLNLRRNPFGELTPEEQAALAVVELEDWPAWLAAGPRRALLLVAPPGRGKTTHLRALGERLAGARWLRPEEDGACAAAEPGSLLLLDDAQRLASRALVRALEPARAVALADHADRARALRRAGWETRTCRLAPATPARLVALVERRVEAVRRDPGPVPHLPLAAAARLLREHAGDVRAVLDLLYWRAQEASGVGPLG